MVMKASSVSAGNSKSASPTSISKTSAPRERNAFATPRPVANDTSRSEPGPPIKTAIFFGSVFISGSAELRIPPLSLSRVLSHDLHFCFQLDTALRARGCLDSPDQFQHLRRGGAAV